jgi:hypothetical protein
MCMEKLKEGQGQEHKHKLANLTETATHQGVCHARAARFALPPLFAAHGSQKLDDDALKVLRHRGFGVPHLSPPSGAAQR